MSVPIDDFWKLTAESQLLPVEKYRQLRLRFRHLRGADGQANSRAAASWLVSQKALTTYQAQVLLSGHSGPFTFGDYRVCNRLPSPLGVRRFDGLHLPTNHRLLLHFWPHGRAHWSTVLSMAQRHSSLSHPNLDRCYETIATAGQRIAISEDVEGVAVTELINSNRLTATEAMRITYQVALALQQLHHVQLIHGFVTPNDILVASGGHAKLRRFPFSQLAPLNVNTPDPKQRLLQQADYLAPELFRSNQPPDPLADVYALGCTLYEMLKGHPPFPGGGLVEKMERHASEPIEPLNDLTSIPNGLPEVVSFMMAKKPSLRYQTAAEVAQRLEAILGSETHTTPPRPKGTEPYYLAYLNRQKQPIPAHLQSSDPPAKTLAAPSAAAPVTPPPAVEIQTVNVESRPKARRPSTTSLVWASAAIVVIITALVLVFSVSRGARDDRPSKGNTTVAENNRAQTDSRRHVEESVPEVDLDGSEIVADDGQTLWASPTSGNPITMDYAPPSSQCFVYVRPKAILQSSDGPAVFKALGPRFEALQDQLSSELGLSLDQLDRLLIALVPQDADSPRATLVMRLAPESVNALAERARTTQPANGGRRVTFETTQAYLPPTDPTVVIAGSPEDIQEIIDQAGQPPLLKRQLERLRLMTDDDRHLTIFLDPHFLAADGRDVFGGEFARLRQPVLDFLGDQIQAISFSVHFADSFYGELLLSPTLDQDPYSLAAACKSRLRELPETVNSHLGKIVIQRFWQPLAVRFPLMINFLHQQTRMGVADGCAVINFAMPGYSAHNLVLASVLAVEASASSPNYASKPVPQALDWDSILTQRIDFEIPQQSLDFTMAELATAVDQTLPQVEFSIVILGSDLQLEGITRNQQIRDVNLKNQPVSEILTELVRRANPTPAELASPDQKLVWVADRHGRADGKTVFITTRSAATQKGYSLPPQFLENPPEP